MNLAITKATLFSARSRLLAGTALTLATFASPAVSQETEPADLTKIDVQGKLDNQQVPQSEGYITYKTRSGSKTSTYILDIPQSISTVTAKELTVRNPQGILEALQYSPAVRPDTFGFDPRMDTFNIRGFDSYNNGIFRDGMRQMSASLAYFKNEPYGIEELTILKGSTSSLYGGSSAGGIVDITTKRPTLDPLREVEVQLGSYGRRDVRFDTSGPLTKDNSVLYRLTGLARKADTERAGVKDDRLFIAPAITFQRDEETSLTVLGEYTNFQTGGTATFWNFPTNRLTNYQFGDPRFNQNKQIQKRIGYEFEHRINDVFQIRQNLRYFEIDQDFENAGNQSFDSRDWAYTDFTFRTPIQRYTYFGMLATQQLTVDNQIQADFATGKLDHTILVGADASWFKYDNKDGSGTAPELNLLSPDYNQYIPRPDLQQFVNQKHRSRGVYIQDQIRYNSWMLTLAARQDWVNISSAEGNYVTGAQTSSYTQKSDKATVRVGLSYETDFGLTPYVNYATSYYVSPGLNPERKGFKPTEATSYELGLKYLLPDTNILLMASVFDINQKNGVFYEIINQDSVQVQRSELNSRGFEFEAKANLNNGIGLRAGYQFLDFEIREGEVGTIGKQQSGVPQHTFSVWGDYEIQDGAAAGLGFGAGLRYVGTSPGDDLGTFDNSSRAFVDAAVTYDFGKKSKDLQGLSLQVNASNIFNTQKATCANNFCNLDGGKFFTGSLKYRF
ncbi:TonB-dependent siderophore receptor [Rhizobium sp. CFBP 8762]|uniref:TonB-dependent siderophore receptor n=1 Tax=Rhizobium sp. CFBP 8762 TaxID=2775279 RepID=UPI0017845DD7|nr:TonB-dependent siderophore receptor [Rhizobium sp. CFBP 8762]MBD8556074.1 TonB-dependent siderophore receptor [Rhizobium sp. CFBP 8762]